MLVAYRTTLSVCRSAVYPELICDENLQRLLFGAEIIRCTRRCCEVRRDRRRAASRGRVVIHAAPVRAVKITNGRADETRGAAVQIGREHVVPVQSFTF